MYIQITIIRTNLRTKYKNNNYERIQTHSKHILTNNKQIIKTNKQNYKNIRQT